LWCKVKDKRLREKVLATFEMSFYYFKRELSTMNRNNKTEETLDTTRLRPHISLI